MKYQLPQFIDIEDKIIGPLTLKQFLYFLAAAMISFILWTFLKFNSFIIATVLVFGIAAIFSFLRINGKPFIYFVINLQNFIFKQQKYTWKQEIIEKKALKKDENFSMPIMKVKKQSQETQSTDRENKISASKLKKLAWSLDIKEDENF